MNALCNSITNRKFSQKSEDTVVRNIGQFRVRHFSHNKLFVNVLAYYRPEWRGQSLLQEGRLSFHPKLYYCSISIVSLPRLIDFDWRVDVKTSSDSVTRMAVPTCLVQMKVTTVYSYNSEFLLSSMNL